METKEFVKSNPRKDFESFEIEDKSSNVSKGLLRESSVRWIALVLLNLIIFGDFVALEGPQPIETQIKEALNVNEEQYSFLYSSWAFPSILSPVFGGYIIDRFGVRPTLIFFSLAVTIGQIIYTYAGYILSFQLMIVGRTIYAIGTDPLNVVQMVLINKWFKGRELALAISLSGSTFGIARAVNSSISPLLYELTQNLGTTMLFASILCIIGTIATFVMAKWDKEDDEREERSYNSSTKAKVLETEKVSLKDMRHFSRIVWLLILSFGFSYGCSFSFNAFTNEFYNKRYGFSNTEAGNIISTNFIVMAISAALTGKVVDSYGHRTTLLTFSSILGTLGYAYYFIFPDCFRCLSTVIPQILFELQLGIGEAVICPALPLVLKEKFLGTGYGLFFMIENILVLILPPVAAEMKELTTTNINDGYFIMICFFTIWSLITIIISVKLMQEDRNRGKVLEKTTSSDAMMREPIFKDADETRLEDGDSEYID